MSEILSKSKSNAFSKYFSQSDEFEKKLSKFSLKSKKLVGSNQHGAISFGGIPLSYNEENNTVFVDDTDTHTLVIGSTGSKKSRLIAMPLVKILEAAHESMIISDPKSEIFNRTASSLKSNGYEIITINLREPSKGDAWNPLAIPYKFFCNGDLDHAFEFANDIATNLMGIDKSQKDPFWDNSSSSFFFGLIMLLLKFCKDANIDENFVNISNVLNLRTFLFKNYYFGDDPTKIIQYAQSDPFIYSLLVGTVETANNTRAGILSFFDQKMQTFSIQPSLSKMLSGSDIFIDKIQSKPTAVFLIVPDEKTSYHNLVSLFVKQSYEYMIYLAQSSETNLKNNVRVNYILDEFSSLPAIHDFPAMITAARSRNIRFNLFVQSKHQLDLKYGEESNTIRANCGNWVFLVSRELSLLQEISELCGVKRHEGVSIPILSVTDLQRLDKEMGEALILSGRKKPYITTLPDIDLYDGKQFDILEAKIKTRNLRTINFEKELKKFERTRIALQTHIQKQLN